MDVIGKLYLKGDKIIGKLVESDYVDNRFINFDIEGNEIMKLCYNGDIFINGKKVENDLEVVDGMREFLTKAGVIK